jgi:hypothetical protein
MLTIVYGVAFTWVLSDLPQKSEHAAIFAGWGQHVQEPPVQPPALENFQAKSNN